MACGICATAGWQLSNWVAGRDELQLEHSPRSIRLPIMAADLLTRDKSKYRAAPVAGGAQQHQETLPEVGVNNPINAKFLNRTSICLPLCSFWGFERLFFFFWNYFTSYSHSIQDLQLPWQYLFRGEREEERERTEEEKKKKVFWVDRELTGFIILSQLILSITGEGAMEGPLKELFAFEWW